MIQLKIDNQIIKVNENITVLEAARMNGIFIPSMCYLKGYSNHPSCMVCVVKNVKTQTLFPSCSMFVSEGMEIISTDDEIFQARKDSLELLISDHVGDCEAPCTLTCPAGMNIPLMNRLIIENKFEESLQLVKEDIALPLILGYICSAPCEKACRRKQIDNPVSICLLKRFVAIQSIQNNKKTIENSVVKLNKNKKIAIIGTGPAGLSAAYYLLKKGYSCTLYDKNESAGGSMRYQIPDSELPKNAIDDEVEIIKKLGAEFYFNITVDLDFFKNNIQPFFSAIVIATGNIESETFLSTIFKTTNTGIVIEDGIYETSIPGIFACGSIIRHHKMAVRSVAQAKTLSNSVDRYLQGFKFEKHIKKFNSKFDKLLQTEFDEYLKEAEKYDRIKPQQGNVSGFTIQDAVNEAKRCMHCDCRKKDHCKLRDYSDQYLVERKKYSSDNRNVAIKNYQHDRIIYEPEKCIRCGLCVDIALKNGELTGLTFMGRGFDVRIQVPFGKNMNLALIKSVELCVNCCPTAALSFK